MNDCFDTTAGGQLLYLGHGIFQNVMESHGILTGHKCTNPVGYLKCVPTVGQSSNKSCWKKLLVNFQIEGYIAYVIRIV